MSPPCRQKREREVAQVKAKFAFKPRSGQSAAELRKRAMAEAKAQLIAEG